MHDMTNAGPGREPVKIAQWNFDAVSLKPLKKKDQFGDGYTLFLPWAEYSPNVKKISLQACYYSEKNVPHYGDPIAMALQSDDLPRTIYQQETLPASHLQPRFGPSGQAPITPADYTPMPTRK
jgi:hypothetical protein